VFDDVPEKLTASATNRIYQSTPHIEEPHVEMALSYS